MVPTQFVFLPRLPLTPNGKVDRKALPAPADAAVADKPLVTGAPRTAEEQLIAEIWRDLLRLDQISVFDNFLDLGGHSLLIMRAIAKIEGKTGIRMSPRIFVFQTLGQIAAELATTKSSAPAPGPRDAG